MQQQRMTAPQGASGDTTLELSPPIRCQLRGVVDGATERLAMRAVLAAARLFGLASGTHLRQLRNVDDPLVQLQAQLEEAQLQAKLAWETNEILAERFRKIPERERPHYTPAQRFRALEIRNLLGWSRHVAARVFLVCPNTVSNWERSADPHAHTVGSTVKPTPPVRRLSDAVRATVALLGRCGFGEMRAALELARAGWKVSARSAGRIFRTSRPAQPAELPPPSRPHRPVVAKFVHHTWMMDSTEIPAFCRSRTFHLAGVFDGFSRVPLVLQLFARRPHASDMARLFREATRRFTVPKYLITDLGGEFTARLFKKAVSRLGAKQRFASALNLYATARLERFWRTLKEMASLRFLAPLTIEDLERRLEPTLAYYLGFRAHQGLRGATPLEVFLGSEPACSNAVSAPRGRPGQGPSQAPFTIEYLEPQSRSFAFLRAAA